MSMHSPAGALLCNHESIAGCRTTDAMAAWLGGQEIMSRPQITSFLWKYIRDEDLLVSSLDLAQPCQLCYGDSS